MMVGGGAGGAGAVLMVTCPMGLPSLSVSCTSPIGGACNREMGYFSTSSEQR